MTTSEWDDTPWSGTPHEGKATVTAKAATGTGVGFFSTAYPISAMDRTPQAIMKRAQLAYHTNPWIGTAEDVVTRKTVNLPWHLEDAEDEEYPEDGTAAPDVAQARQLIERPQFALPPDLRKANPGTSSRRLMWGLTCRHVGLCGMAHWFGDQMDIRGIPVAWLYVNPARMWSGTDALGNLTHWVIDATGVDGRGQPVGGMRLELSEILTFYLRAPDNGHYATGIYERAFLKGQTSGLADQHAAYVLGTGGRIAGIVSPKEGTIPDEQFQNLIREFRNVNEAPDAAKRTTILQGPIDFTPTAADPSELNLVELSKMNRDDILGIWNVPPTQVGIPPAHGGGLNSGSTKGYDEAILMQGPVHDRVQALKETIQFGWLDLYKPTVIELEIVEPTFDDESPAYALLGESIGVALTNAERRDIIGLPPTGDPAIDDAILLPVLTTRWATAPAEGSSAPGTIDEDVAPEPPVVPFGAPPIPPAKADTRTEFLGLRKSLDTRFVPAVRKSVQGALSAQRDAIVAWIRSHEAHIAKKPTDMTWWNEAAEDKRLAAAIDPHVTAIASVVTTRAKDVLARPGKAGFEAGVASFVHKRTTERIKKMNQTTREQVQDAIVQGFEQGLSAAEVAALIEGSTTFDEMRAERIARSEAMYAYNDAALNSYTEFGVTMVEPIDGDQDEECIARLERGPVTIDEALDDTDHPNGTLDWAPYFGDGKAGPGAAFAERAHFRTGTDDSVPPQTDIAALLRELVPILTPQKADPVSISVVSQDHKLVRTVFDRDLVTGKIIGTHPEPFE